ncbi:hypothetical protein BWK60_12450 [Flavobacterium covae]|uniref:hypothetical protein n=1 Tax=Flavobacterium covae TaxID=2906076 RepID=UPI000B4DD8EB|nr:hypothetical protein [Flavobacterium covae]OWP85750.1 hypothetical protein BWK60_12450 [Flavobacterium covae]
MKKIYLFLILSLTSSCNYEEVLEYVKFSEPSEKKETTTSENYSGLPLEDDRNKGEGRPFE